MKNKYPNFIRYLVMITIYPTLYMAWVRQIKDTWINNNIKDLHPEILFPTANRFTKISSPYDYRKQFAEVLVREGEGGLKQQYLDKINKNKKSYDKRKNQ